MQARNAVMGKIHEALVDGTLHADEAKVLEEMSEMLKESFEVRLTSVLQSEFDGECAVDDANVGTVSFISSETRLWKSQHRTDVRARRSWTRKALLESVQSCKEDQFQFEWKESLQTKLTNETLVMRSNSIIDKYSASGDDELNDETIDAEDSEDDAGCRW